MNSPVHRTRPCERAVSCIYSNELLLLSFNECFLVCCAHVDINGFTIAFPSSEVSDCLNLQETGFSLLFFSFFFLFFMANVNLPSRVFLHSIEHVKCLRSSVSIDRKSFSSRRRSVFLRTVLRLLCQHAPVVKLLRNTLR